MRSGAWRRIDAALQLVGVIVSDGRLRCQSVWAYESHGWHVWQLRVTGRSGTVVVLASGGSGRPAIPHAIEDGTIRVVV